MIQFRQLRFSNFLSVGNTPVEIDLSGYKTTLVHGTNGSGKSTILDALTYVLYNKPFRRINLPQLVNTQNKKGLLVEVLFSIGNDEYVVARGQKPKVFEIYKNKELVEPKAADKDNQSFLEQNILKLTYKSFIQIVILGSASYVPFMQLPAAGRRECIEDFLDIKVFSTMSVIAKERLRGLKDSYKDIERNLDLDTFKLETVREKIRENLEKSDDKKNEILHEISMIDTQVDFKVKELESLQNHRTELEGIISDVLSDNPESKLAKFTKAHIKLQSRIEELDTEALFYSENDSCMSCGQELDERFKLDKISKAESETREYSKAVLQAQQRINDLESKIQYVRERESEIQATNSNIRIVESDIKNLHNTKNRLEWELNELSQTSLEADRAKEEVLQDLVTANKFLLDQKQEEIDNHEVVVTLLKDSGIKTQIVKKYLPVMNKFIRKYLTDLDFPIHFELDNEFNETVRSPLHQDFSYASFSEGQKGRIDLSLMFTWREICKLKNSVSTNLLILDEVFSSSLDEGGKEFLMALLKYKLDDKQNVIVVDHTLNDAFKEKFDKAILVDRVKGFSRYS